MCRVQYLPVVWLFGLVLTGCGGSTEPDTGTIEATSVTTGDPTDPDGYTLAVDGDQGRPFGTNAGPIVAEVVRKVDSRHAAAPKLALDPISVGEAGLKLAGDYGQFGALVREWLTISRSSYLSQTSSPAVWLTSWARQEVIADGDPLF